MKQHQISFQKNKLYLIKLTTQIFKAHR